MTRVHAAIDNSSATTPVLRTARWLAGLLATEVTAFQVREDGSATASAAAEAAGVALAIVHGDPITAITEQFSLDDVLVGVLGARSTPSGRRPVGHVALTVAQASTTPLVVVPCDHVPPSTVHHLRLLLPLDGSKESSQAARDAAQLFSGPDTEFVALHVFDATTVPPFWDQPQHATENWRHEFAARHIDDVHTALELRTGSAGDRVVDVAESEAVDLIALSWSQDFSAGRAETVREVLTRATVPVILFPVLSSSPTPADEPLEADRPAAGGGGRRR